MQPFYVYILKCKDSSYYTGHTDNLEKRLMEHRLANAPCYTSDKLPVELVYFQEFTTRDEALAAEQKIKGWSRKKKEALIKNDWNQVSILSRKIF